MGSLTAALAQQALIPQEKLAGMKEGQQRLTIGIPKESSANENRIALSPEAVGLLIRNGHDVLVEKEAGIRANFQDHQFMDLGATVTDNKDLVLGASIVLKIAPPTNEEFQLIQPEATVFSTLNFQHHSKEYFDKVNNKRITGVAFEYLKDPGGGNPVVRAMSEIAGGSAMLIAAELLSTTSGGKGMLLGGITGVQPTKVVVLGAGTVAEYAAKAALGLGADIKIFDREIYRLQRLRYAVGQHVHTSIIDSVNLEEAITRADVVIGAMRSENGVTPCVVTEEMVMKMKPNSIIIDVAIDQGGCFETSEITTFEHPTFKHHGVIHYCVPNIASRFANTASLSLSNIFTPILIKIGSMGGPEELLFTNPWFQQGVYSYRGSITNKYVSKKFGFRYKDLTLLSAARF